MRTICQELWLVQTQKMGPITSHLFRAMCFLALIFLPTFLLEKINKLKKTKNKTLVLKSSILLSPLVLIFCKIAWDEAIECIWIMPKFFRSRGGQSVPHPVSPLLSTPFPTSTSKTSHTYAKHPGWVSPRALGETLNLRVKWRGWFAPGEIRHKQGWGEPPGLKLFLWISHRVTHSWMFLPPPHLRLCYSRGLAWLQG